jgi:hypothetical protein
LRVLTELVPAAAHITKQYGTDEIVKALASDDELTQKINYTPRHPVCWAHERSGLGEISSV